MGKVYDNMSVEIPKVKGIVVCHNDNDRVLYVLANNYDRTVGYTRPSRVTIGKVIDRTHMHPNDKFRELFPALWESASGERAKPLIKHIGLYAAVREICEQNSVKRLLDEAFGSTVAADLLDYAQHSILHHTNTAASFADSMKEEMTFSGILRGKDYFSRLFANGMDRSSILHFKKLWAQKCAASCNKNKGVWICIDGSNDDCQSQGVILAEKGHAKTGKNVDIVSFTYAVTEQGLPITYELYRGGLVDSKAMRSIIDFLHECGFEVKGVILDRGYCDSGCIQFLRDNHLAYEIMIKGQTVGVTKTIAEYGNQIKMNAKYLVYRTCLFAAQSKTQLFSDLKGEDYINVFYDGSNGMSRYYAMMNRIYREMERIDNKILAGEPVEVDPKYADVINLVSDDNSTQLSLNTEVLQKKIDEKGLYGIVCSEPLHPREVHRLYTCRNSSETQYMLVKTQLGYGKVRIQQTPSAYSLFLTGFLAAIIRHQMESVARSFNRSTTDLIRELDLIEMVNVNGNYSHVHSETGLQEKVFKELGVTTDVLDKIAREENDRLAGRKPQPRYRKTGPKPKPKDTAPAKQSDPEDAGSANGGTNPVRAKPGPKPGFKRGEFNKDGSPRQKPGPKLGSHLGDMKLDGTPRQKPGPKSGSHRRKPAESATVS